MIVLTRGAGEDLVIGGDVLVRVVAVRDDYVELAFDGPSDAPLRWGDAEGDAELCGAFAAENAIP
ncbi:MAG TPA: carbon storage regulator [Planctomycetaceae bacterium]